MKNKKFFAVIGCSAVLSGILYLTITGKWKKTNVDTSTEEMLDVEIANIKRVLSSNNINAACRYYNSANSLIKFYPFKNSTSRQEYQSSIYKLVGEKCENLKNKNNIASKDPLRNSDNNLERDDRTNIPNSKDKLEAERKKAETTILSLRVETREEVPNFSSPKIIKTEYREVRVPSGPTCSDLADRVQQVYNDSYTQGMTPVRVQFFGTDNYYSVPLKLSEEGGLYPFTYKHIQINENVYIEAESGDREGNTFKVLPKKIVCRMRNASYVEYRPTGNRHCRDIEVTYDFDRNSFGYGRMNRQYCDESR